MAESLNPFLVKHIANGTLSQLCIVCLAPLEENFCENIFTLICKTDSEFCVAEALAAVCQFEFQEHENYNICTNCFIAATSAYKFQQKAKRSMELISFYTQELLTNINNIQITDDDMDKLLCIPLTDYSPKIQVLDVNLHGIGIRDNTQYDGEQKPNRLIEEEIQPDDNILVVVENNSSSENDIQSEKSQVTDNDEEEVFMIINEKKVRKKRDPMVYLKCSRCPVKYRFVSKLKAHMKKEHDIDIYYCKICKILTEEKAQYEDHLKEHLDEYQCAICNAIYKKKESLEMHMKQHEKSKHIKSEQLENANMCEVCGAICDNEESLEEHTRARHMKRFTCFYCGRHYRTEASFEQHVRKHELRDKAKHGSKLSHSNNQAEKLDKSKRSVCSTCGKDFVDERSLLWHQRLHSNDRPYTCQECGRGFVSVNRRNQHALCAHTPPARRCPLCPALFHLRSMVNTHVKKVHLKAHKRRNRTSKHQNVFWKTEAVPIQELSIDVQNDVLELQAAQGGEAMSEFED